MLNQGQLTDSDKAAEVNSDGAPASQNGDAGRDPAAPVLDTGGWYDGGFANSAPGRTVTLHPRSGLQEAAGTDGDASPTAVDTAGAADPATTLLASDIAQGFRDRWRDIQMRFVDDPRAVAGEAQWLVEEAFDASVAVVKEQQKQLEEWQGDVETEQLRVFVRRNRDLLDRLLDL